MIGCSRRSQSYLYGWAAAGERTREVSTSLLPQRAIGGLAKFELALAELEHKRQELEMTCLPIKPDKKLS